MYHFVVEKSTQNILCYSDKDGSLVATSESPFEEKEKWDFWTSIKIGEELFDINIWYGGSVQWLDELEEEGVEYNPFELSLYPLILNDEGNYEINDFVERKFPFKYK